MTEFLNEKQAEKIAKFGKELAWGGSVVGTTRHEPQFQHERASVALPNVPGERGTLETRSDHAEGFVVDVYDDAACALILDHSLRGGRGEPVLVCTFPVQGQARPRVAAVWGEPSSARELMRGMLSEGGRAVPGVDVEPSIIKAHGLAYVGA
jgi:hypothetical protein